MGDGEKRNRVAVAMAGGGISTWELWISLDAFALRALLFAESLKTKGRKVVGEVNSLTVRFRPNQLVKGRWEGRLLGEGWPSAAEFFSGVS